MACVVVCAVLSAACGQAASTSTGKASKPSAAPNTGPSTPTAEPKLAASYHSNCAYQLGDFSEGSKSGYRFTADGVVTNTGTVGAVVQMRATWFLAGGDAVRDKTALIRVPAGAKRRIGITHPASQDQILAHQDYTVGKDCTAVVKLLRPYGVKF